MNNLRTLSSALLALMTASSAFGVNALRDLQSFTQPDGSVVELRRVGDEAAHYFETSDNLPVIASANGTMEFASLRPDGTLLATGVKATSPANRLSVPAATLSLAGKSADILSSLRMTLNADEDVNGTNQNRAAEKKISGLPTLGDVRTLVVLVEYADQKFNLSDPAAYYEGILNTEGYSEYGATGSAREYFESNSSGLFSPTFDIYGPVALSQNRAYYGANTSVGKDARAHEMVIEAARLLDSSVDFSAYDLDDDGYIDNIFVIYAGQGEASYGDADCVWPHSSQLAKRRMFNEHDGVCINRYACTNEWLNNRPDGVGTFIHEMSHVLGLPDLYNTEDARSTATPGAWSVLDYGQYNNRGCTPPNYSAFERMMLGWLTPADLSSPEAMELHPLGDSNEARIISVAGNDNEYFLVENRQNSGWDAFLPGHGMMVWHIDFQADRFAENKVNTDDARQLVDIVEACGSADCWNSSLTPAYAWTGHDGNDRLGFHTSPRLASWNGEDTGVELTNIFEASHGVIYCLVNGGPQEVPDPQQGPEVAGLADVDAGFGFSIDGMTVSVSGAEISLYDLSGKKVASGLGSVEAPAAGLYILSTPAGSAKVRF